MTWRGWHLLVGGAGMLLFVLTGYYMLRVAGVPELPDSERLLYRSSHIYLLLVCVANVYVGYAMPAGVKPGRPQVLCSAVLLFAVPLLAWSFFAEPPDITEA